jgi:hypothetical protein
VPSRAQIASGLEGADPAQMRGPWIRLASDTALYCQKIENRARAVNPPHYQGDRLAGPAGHHLRTNQTGLVHAISPSSWITRAK